MGALKQRREEMAPPAVACAVAVVGEAAGLAQDDPYTLNWLTSWSSSRERSLSCAEVWALALALSAVSWATSLMR